MGGISTARCLLGGVVAGVVVRIGEDIASVS